MNVELEKVEGASSGTLSDAVKTILHNASEKKRKFKETVEIILNCSFGKDEQSLRGFCILPNGLDKETKVVVFIPADNSAKRDLALKAGADRVGYDDLIIEIEAGKIDQNAIYMTSASFMAGLKKIASKLGAKGLMPNMKTGTLVDSLENSIPDMKKNVTFFKSGKTNMIQTKVGTVEMEAEKLEENIKVLVRHIMSQTKATNLKGFVKSIFIKSTMGPAVRVENLDFI